MLWPLDNVHWEKIVRFFFIFTFLGINFRGMQVAPFWMKNKIYFTTIPSY
jgi:hypothetical protein